MSDLTKRVASASVALVILASVLYVGGLLFKIFLFAVLLLGTHELHRAFSNKFPKHCVYASLSFVSIWFWTVYLAERAPTEKRYFVLMVGLSLLLSLILASMFLSLAKDKENIKGLMADLLAVFYIAIPVSMFMVLSDFDILYLILIIAFSSDSFALFTGKAIGKRKLAPSMSPNKTVEGSIGAVLGTVLALLIAKHIHYSYLSYLEVILLGLFGSMFAQLGDLTASLLKRYCEIKDFGKIMPGHGGILDRLDSIVFVTPLVFLLHMVRLMPDIASMLR